LNGGLKNIAECKKSWFQKKILLVPILHVRTIGWPGTGKNVAFSNLTAQLEQGFEFKVS
jgi:hypothetical protein